MDMCRRILGCAVAIGVVALSGCKSADGLFARERASNHWLQENQSTIFEPTSDREPEILPGTHFAAGQLFEKQGQTQRAIAQYQQAIGLDPEFTSAYNRLAICLDRVGLHNEAERVLREGVRIEPAAAYLRNNLGFNLMAQGRWQEAEQQFRQALRMNPDYQRARINLGVALNKQSLSDEAFTEFQVVLGGAFAHYNMGLLHKADGDYARAAESFRQALAGEPTLTAAKVQLERVRSLRSGVEQGTPDKFAVVFSEQPSVNQANGNPPVLDERHTLPLTVADSLPGEEAEPPQLDADPLDPGRPVVVAQAPPAIDPAMISADVEQVPESFADEPLCLEAERTADPQMSIQTYQTLATARTETKTTAPAGDQLEPEVEPAAPSRIVPLLPEGDLKAAVSRRVGLAPTYVLGAVAVGSADDTAAQPNPDSVDAAGDDDDFLGHLPLTLCNEPCEPAEIAALVARLVEAMKPCAEGEFVDQFVFGGGYDLDDGAQDAFDSSPLWSEPGAGAGPVAAQTRGQEFLKHFSRIGLSELRQQDLPTSKSGDVVESGPNPWPAHHLPDLD